VAAAALLSACGGGQDKDGVTVGFSQIGSESGWRAAETRMARTEAERRGIELKVSDAQQRQENQIKAIRSFVAQGVDGILLAPVVSTGWDQVLGEARKAGVPVVLVDRTINGDPNLYLAAVGADNVAEGRVAAEWLIGRAGARKCDVVELQGTVGSNLVRDRKKGFDDAIAKTPNVRIVRSQTGEFTRAKGKEVMEGFIKAVGGNQICAVYAHNDDMMIGAIQAMTEAGLKPGKDVLTVSIDAVPDIFAAMAAGQANATVELTPNMAGPALDVLLTHLKTKAPPAQKVIKTPSTLFLPETAQAEYDRRKDLY
jgi:simple sugar transport system substrate-binding protein